MTQRSLTHRRLQLYRASLLLLRWSLFQPWQLRWGGGVKPTCGTSEQTPNLTEHIGGFSSFGRGAFSLRKQAAA